MATNPFLIHVKTHLKQEWNLIRSVLIHLSQGKQGGIEINEVTISFVSKLRLNGDFVCQFCMVGYLGRLCFVCCVTWKVRPLSSASFLKSHLSLSIKVECYSGLNWECTRFQIWGSKREAGFLLFLISLLWLTKIPVLRSTSCGCGQIFIKTHSLCNDVPQTVCWVACSSHFPLVFFHLYFFILDV